jgi:uncharacterized protein YmfQ (DUF2313 family)
MYARVATFEGVNMEVAQRTMKEAEERLEPIMREIEGLQGSMELVDKSSGKYVGISIFDTEENMQAAERIFDEEMPKALGDLMQDWEGRRTSVDRYEIVGDRRPERVTA